MKKLHILSILLVALGTATAVAQNPNGASSTTQSVSHTYIPADGPSEMITDASCPLSNTHWIVNFDEFADDAVIRSEEQIRSLCINFNHPYMGDYRIALRCPSYRTSGTPTQGQSIIKYGSYGSGFNCDPLAPSTSPDGHSAGGATNTGFVNSAFPHDGTHDPLGCGYGLDYCWSRNEEFTYLTGDNANTTNQNSNMYISTSDRTIDSTVTLPHPDGTTYTQTQTTRQPSNPDNKTDYYRPTNDFSELIGCPLNGEWELTIVDFAMGDDGWLFSWTLELESPTPELEAISNTTQPTFAVKVQGRNLSIKTESNLPLSIHDIMGRLIASGRTCEGTTYTMPSTGFYIVKVGNGEAQKVLVR